MRIVTHTWADLDGLIAIEILRRFGKEKIPGIENAEILYWDGNPNTLPRENAVFVDISPIAPDPEKKVYVFDHHPHGKHPWTPESKEPWQRWHTATSKVVEFLGLDLEDPKISELVRWAFRADFKSGGDQMNILNIVKEMHLSYSESEVQKWISATVEAHLKSREINFQKGIEFFKNSLQKFISENSPAKMIFQRWLERAEKATEDKMNTVHRAAVNLVIFGPEKTQEWVSMAFKAIEQGQKIFREASEDFQESEKILVGGKVIVIGVSANPRFNRYCRSSVAKTKMPKPLDKKEDPIVVQFWPENKGFQIYTNKSGYKLFDVVGALRCEILKARNRKAPMDWKTLKREGVLEGTEPLYYQQGGYEVVMWGSLTNPRVMPMDISMETVKRVVVTAVDQQYFPSECQKSRECLRYKCPLYQWQLWRCFQRRKSLRS